MSKAKSKKKIAALSAAAVVSSVALTSYALNNAAKTNIDSETALNLNVDKIDKDTVKISVSNLSEGVTSLQLGLKIDGDAKFNSANSINWLLENDDSIDKNVNISNEGQYLDVVLVSNDEIQKKGSTIDICEIDVAELNSKSSSNEYRIVPRNDENSYAYVNSINNKSKSGNDFVNSSEDVLRINAEPEITLKQGKIAGAVVNKDRIEVEEGYDFEANYKSFIETSDLENDEVQVSYKGRLKTSVAGSYNVTFMATDAPGDTTEKLVTVDVVPSIVNEAPTITGVKETHTVYTGDVFEPLEGVSATDAKGNDVEVKLSGDFDLTKAGEYTLTYTATDKWHNTATKTMKLTVIKDEAPVITGVEDKKIEFGTNFDPLDGVEVTDDRDNDIKSKLEVSGTVNTNLAGEYKLVYTVTDKAGNTTKAQRVITVKEQPAVVPPSISGIIDTNIVDILSGNGESTSPLVLELKKTELDKLNKFLDDLKGFKAVVVSIYEDGDYTVFKIKITSTDSKLLNIFKSKTEINLELRVKNEYTDLLERVKEFAKETNTVEQNSLPVINASNVTITVGDKFDPMSGVTATDKEDKDLTDKITVSGQVDTSKAGEYKLTYTVTDSNGGKTELTRIVRVVEKATNEDNSNSGSNGATNENTSTTNNAPVINVSDITISLGQKFDTLLGVTATDKEDGDLTDKIKVEGTVDTSKVGEYKITYSVKDSNNYEVKVIRTVTVVKDIYDYENPKTFDSGIAGYISLAAAMCSGIYITMRNKENE